MKRKSLRKALRFELPLPGRKDYLDGNWGKELIYDVVVVKGEDELRAVAEEIKKENPELKHQPIPAKGAMALTLIRPG